MILNEILRVDMRIKVIVFVLMVSCCQLVFAQRGVGVMKTNPDGSKQEVKLYDGSYGLVIGNSEYPEGWNRLGGVKKDVVAVRDILERHGFKVEVEENLTTERFETRIRKFINDYGFDRDNRLVIYYAGHGHTLKSVGDTRDLGYIIPADTPLPDKDPRGFLQKAVSMYAIQTFARNIQAKHAMFVFDSCFSGKLFALRNTPNITPFIVDKVDYPVRQFITAGDETQVVPDESIFRRAFVRGLEGEADRNNDGYIVGTELAEYLKEIVTNYSNRRQTPQSGKINDIDLDRGDLVFVLPILTSHQLSPLALQKLSGFEPIKSPIPWIKSAEFKTLARKMSKYFSVSDFSEDLAIVRTYDKANGFAYGYINRNGEEVIPLKYDDASDFSEGLARIAITNYSKPSGEFVPLEYGFIDKTGKEVIPRRYADADSFSDGLARVFDGRKYGFIDKKGKVILPFKYGEGGRFSEGLAPQKMIADKYGFIDKSGKVAIAPGYDFAYPFYKGAAIVGLDNRPLFKINKKGKIIFLFTGVELIGDDFGDLIPVKVNGKWGYMNLEGKIVIPANYDEALSFQDGLAFVYIGTRAGYIDPTGKEVIPLKYNGQWCHAFDDRGIRGVLSFDGKKGFVDFYGNEYFDF
jgi:uncharacterized caspase-like protein